MQRAGRKNALTEENGSGVAVRSTIDGRAWALSEDECWNLLSRNVLGRLGVIVSGKPDMFPVNYVTDGPHVLFRTAPGTKLAALTENPDVAFEVDEYDDDSAASVVLKGTAKRLDLQREIDAAEELPLASWLPTLKYRWVRIFPTSISGRRFERGPEPPRYVASVRDA